MEKGKQAVGEGEGERGGMPTAIAGLPCHVVQQLLLFTSAAELAALSSTCRALVPGVKDEAYWAQHIERTMSLPQGLKMSPRDLSERVARVKQDSGSEAESDCELGCGKERSKGPGPLLSAALGASSQDQPEEASVNTLSPSACYMGLSRVMASKVQATSAQMNAIAVHFQQRCGCCQGQPCYWSSSGSSGAHAEDELVYGVEGPSLITEFRITPYTAWWQPMSPTYSPLAVELELFHPDWDSGKSYFRSGKMIMKAGKGEQTFFLSKPVLCLGGMARLKLYGRATRQTLGPEAGEGANDYCLSHVSLVGSKLGYVLEAVSLTPSCVGLTRPNVPAAAHCSGSGVPAGEVCQHLQSVILGKAHRTFV
jgi:hypothetical protein